MKPLAVFTCEACEGEIKDGECYHLIIVGKVFRFCSSAHRNEFRRLKVQLAVTHG